jgi:hypothetical protein
VRQDASQPGENREDAASQGNHDMKHSKILQTL